MKYFFMVIIFFFLTNCNKPRTVFICGDHICVNKAEAEQFFKENLSIEVKILNKKNKKKIDLVELNLNNNNEKKKISLISKKNSKKDLKTLSNHEIAKIKENIKQKKKQEIVLKKESKQKDKIINSSSRSSLNNKISKIEKNKKISKQNIMNKKNNDVVDICTILKKCNIDEISKYLLDKGKSKDFPDITKRQ